MSEARDFLAHVPPLRQQFNGEAFERTPKPHANGQAAAPLQYTDITRDLVPRNWLVPELVPARNVTLLSGEGAVGKSLLLLQLAAAVALGRDWIGTLPAQGPAVVVGCEDDDDEMRRRFEAIAQHYGVSRADMAADLHVLSLAGEDATLAYADRNERLRQTPLFEQMRKDLCAIKPKLIVLDTVADVFGGRENDRSQTRQFITMMRGLAHDADAAVVLVSHPSSDWHQ